jgi:queuine tRNA-ribosyltransferase
VSSELADSRSASAPRGSGRLQPQDASDRSGLTFEPIGDAPRDGARAGVLRINGHEVRTPAFMPVGTHGAVNAITPAILREHGVEIIVCNAFRLAEQPGRAILRSYPSLADFMGWPGPILTDSGGFQVYRVANRTLTEQGVEFRTERKSTMLWTPESAIDIQAVLRTDLVMPLDVCVALPASHGELRTALERTLRWAERSLSAGGLAPGQTLFGIVQGGTAQDLRARSIEALKALGFRMFAIGGLNVGESDDDFRRTLGFTAAALPVDTPRYLMGVGRPRAMLEAVALGVDLMDSILPSRLAREGSVFTRRGLIHLRKERYAKDRFPIDPSCGCYTCQRLSRGYLHHVFGTTRTSAQLYCTIHNIAFCVELMQRARQAILDGCFASVSGQILAELGGDREELGRSESEER